MGIQKYTRFQLISLVTLRVIIGWHFLYEGLVKITNPNWSSVGFLLDSEGLFKGFFYSLAANPTILRITDLLNIWGLIAIGLGMILGFLSRWALIAGVVLLGFYYLSHPPFVGLVYDMPMEGSYLIVNRILIELVALIVLLLFPTSREIGLDRFIFKTGYGQR
jgi:thiosulfate dehydrogenase [quinone] large subunit